MEQFIEETRTMDVVAVDPIMGTGWAKNSVYDQEYRGVALTLSNNRIHVFVCNSKSSVEHILWYVKWRERDIKLEGWVELHKPKTEFPSNRITPQKHWTSVDYIINHGM